MIVPSYAELTPRSDGPPGSSWNVFHSDPERGMANFAGAEQVRDAAGIVSTGEVFSLDYALDAFDPPMARARGVPRHEILSSHPEARDDVLREFFLQATSQVDGLRHRRASGYGFYNGIPDEDIEVGSPALGIQRWAEKPIVGRGVLIDIEGWAARRRRPLDHFCRPGPTGQQPGRRATGPGHRTPSRRPGPGAHRVGELVPRRRRHAPAARSGTPVAAPGSGSSLDLPEWLWDNQIALFATDTFAVEVLPVVADSPFTTTAPEDRGMMHQELIAKLGVPWVSSGTSPTSPGTAAAPGDGTPSSP